MLSYFTVTGEWKQPPSTNQVTGQWLGKPWEASHDNSHRKHLESAEVVQTQLREGWDGAWGPV